MQTLAWNWLAAPYLLCGVAIAAVGAAAALIRGDRVLRLGIIGAAASALPWATCSAIAACTHDIELAGRVLRLGTGPVSLIGPDLLIVLLGVSGQLERYRWLARAASVFGGLLLAACWFTDWTVPGARELPSGMFYNTAGPLTAIHLSQLALWIGLGLVIARQATPRAERRRMVYLLVAVLALCCVGATDTLIVYDIAGIYPIAWLPSTLACLGGLALVLRTDILRPRGFDRGALIELVGFVVATVAIGGVAFAVPGASPLPFAALGSLVWVIATGSAWAIARNTEAPRPADDRVADVVTRIAELADEGAIADRLGTLWKDAVGIDAVATWLRGSDDALAPLYGGEPWHVPADVIAWLVQHPDPLAINDLATMRLGGMRAGIEGLGSAHGASLIVPLVDRGELVAVIETMYERALREGERGFVAATARAAARQLTFVRLSREAAREREIAREVEIAEAMRLQASASRDDEPGGGRSSPPIAARRARPARALVGDAPRRRPTRATRHGGPGPRRARRARDRRPDRRVHRRDHGRQRPHDRHAPRQPARQRRRRRARGGQPVAAFVAILDADAGELEWGAPDTPART